MKPFPVIECCLAVALLAAYVGFPRADGSRPVTTREAPAIESQLRRSGVFHRISGKIVSDPMVARDVCLPPLLLVDNARAATDGWDPALLAAQVITTARGEAGHEAGFRVLDVPCGSYSLFCLWDGVRPVRHTVLLEDDYPQDEVEVSLRPARTWRILNDALPPIEAATAFYSGPWPEPSVDVAVMNGDLYLEERDPDGLPSRLQIVAGGERHDLKLVPHVADAPYGPLMLSALLESPQVGDAVRWASPSPAAISCKAGSESGYWAEYYLQSHRRGAGVYLLLPDGTWHFDYSNAFGELRSVLPLRSCALALIEGSNGRGWLAGAVVPGSTVTSIGRLPVFEAFGGDDTLIVLREQHGDNQPTQGEVGLATGAHGVNGALNREGVGIIRWGKPLSSGDDVVLTVRPADRRWLSTRLSIPDHETVAWRLPRDTAFKTVFLTFELPQGRIELQNCPNPQPERIVLSRVADGRRFPIWAARISKDQEAFFGHVQPGQYVITAVGSPSWRAEVTLVEGDRTVYASAWRPNESHPQPEKENDE